MKFTPFDDMRLRELINPNGLNNWDEIARKMVNRNARQCKDRWEYYLSPMVNTGPWSAEEDKVLLELYQRHGSKWTIIAQYFRGSTNTCCKNRWLFLKRTADKEKTHISTDPIDEVFQNIPDMQSNLPIMDQGLSFEEMNPFDYFISSINNENDNEVMTSKV